MLDQYCSLLFEKSLEKTFLSSAQSALAENAGFDREQYRVGF